MSTPDAQVTSISATQRDKHEFIKYLVAEIRRLKVDMAMANPLDTSQDLAKEKLEA